MIAYQETAPSSVKRVEEIFLSPPSPDPAPGVIEALRAADLIVLGPGSLYTSLIACLLVRGVADALLQARGLKVLVQNVMTQPGETDGMTAADHLRAVQRHAGRSAVDVLLCARDLPPEEVLARYRARGAAAVPLARRAVLDLVPLAQIPPVAERAIRCAALCCSSLSCPPACAVVAPSAARVSPAGLGPGSGRVVLGVVPVVAPLLAAGRRVRHSPTRLARVLAAMLE